MAATCSAPALRLDEISFAEAARQVERHHYTAKPFARQFNVGVWEDGRLVGALVFGPGATPRYGLYFGCPSLRVRELNRVALGEHSTPTSRIVAISLRLLERKHPATGVVVSFADMEQGHLGTLYQASNFRYYGSVRHTSFVIHGRREHNRSVGSRYGSQSLAWLRENVDPEARRVTNQPKHRYAYFFDPALERQVAHRRRPFPKASEV